MARSEGGLDQWKPFDLSAIADDVLLQAGQEIDRLGLHLHAEMTPALISGDSRLVERLVANLVDNALRYNTPAGHFELLTGTSADAAFITVTNTGTEIPPDEMGRLLQPFKRLGPHRTDHGESTGLALSIVQAITAAHGAALTPTPRPGGGL
jgi:signal transduction histidine kinase